MVINSSTDDVAMTRGDSESLTVRKMVDGAATSWVPGEIITLTIRTYAEGEIVFQRVVTEFDDGGAAVIAINPEDTEDLAFGRYVYDIQCTTTDGTVTTLIPRTPGNLPGWTITQEATY